MLLRLCMQSRNTWDHGVHSTNIATSAYFVISVLSPVCSPWILYDPERLVLKADWGVTSSSIPYQKNSMIQSSKANVRAWNSSHICLHENCIDTHCKNQRLDSFYKSMTLTDTPRGMKLTCKGTMFHQISSDLILVNRNDTEVRNRGSDFGLVKFAGTTVIPSVRVILLSLKSTNLQGVLESSGHKPTITPWVTRTILLWITL